MDPITIALIGTASFGTIVAFAAFIRQIWLSRDKGLNDKAQRIGIEQEAEKLKNMRDEMLNQKRYVIHYELLDQKKNEVAYFDLRIDEIFNNKLVVLKTFADNSLRISKPLNQEKHPLKRKTDLDNLMQIMDKQLKDYDEEIEKLQRQRGEALQTHTQFQKKLLEQEAMRNRDMAELYKEHSRILEQVILRHIENADSIARSTIEAGTSAFSSIISTIATPFQLLMSYFNISTGISFQQAPLENMERMKVSEQENELNNSTLVHALNKKEEVDLNLNDTSMVV